MIGLARWVWWRLRAWPWEVWCGRFHYRRHWRIVALRGGEAWLACRRCGRRWSQLVPGASP